MQKTDMIRSTILIDANEQAVWQHITDVDITAFAHYRICPSTTFRIVGHPAAPFSTSRLLARGASKPCPHGKLKWCLRIGLC